MARREQAGRRFGRAQVFLVAHLLSVFVAGLVLLPGQAQSPAAEVAYTRNAAFRIPFDLDPPDRRVSVVELWVSVDQGRRWDRYESAHPNQGAFNFRAQRDGLYWFAVRTVEPDGRANPPVMQPGVPPALRVYVDTQEQTVFLRSLPSREGQVGVEWEVRDRALDLQALRLDYRQTGGGNWVPVRVNAAATGQTWLNAAAYGSYEVRLRVLDAYGNPREATAIVGSPTDNHYAGGDPRGPYPAARPLPGSPAQRIVNSKQIKLTYKVDGVGKSGIGGVQLWWTRDTKTWRKAEEDSKGDQPFIFNATDQGLYGFTIVARSGAGFGDQPPQAGDPPQLWVEVDLEKPIVQLYPVEVGRGPDLGKITITWQATDKNLLERPITLYYGEGKDGPWLPIAKEYENTRRYVWAVPQEAPYKFFVKIEALDKAGNVGSDQTAKEVIVDVAIPRGSILGVDTAADK
jgi:hypothetical protein